MNISSLYEIKLNNYIFIILLVFYIYCTTQQQEGAQVGFADPLIAESFE